MLQGLKKGTALQNGTYRIEEVLGQGSFGITYLAVHVRLKKKIAIKEFFMGEVNSRKDDGTTVEGSTGSVFTDYRRKFRKEAENLANLRHTNIVNVSDIFDENGTSYYVMDFIEGSNLDKYISEKGHLSEKEAIEITLEIGKALEYMHSKDMLHLDIKPSNIMRCTDGRHYLIDFGLSKQFSKDGRPEETTSIGLGTPGYAPIEQSSYKQDGTFPSTLDVYALGATLYKLLTGVRPPDATYILNDGGLPIQNLKKNKVSNQTIKTLKKAMKPAFRDRYQSVGELINDLIASNINSKEVDERKEDLSDLTVVDNSSNLAAIGNTGMQFHTKNKFPLREFNSIVLDKASEIWIDYSQGGFVSTSKNIKYRIGITRQSSKTSSHQYLYRPDEFSNVLNGLRQLKLKIQKTKNVDPPTGKVLPTLTISLYDKDGNNISKVYAQDNGNTKIGNIDITVNSLRNEIIKLSPSFKDLLINSEIFSKNNSSLTSTNSNSNGTVKINGTIHKPFLTQLLNWILKSLFLGICGISVFYGSSYLIRKCSSPSPELYAKRIRQNPTIEKLINNMIFVEGGWSLGLDSIEPFHIGKYEVTQREWIALMDYNPSIHKGPNLPVSNVTIEECQEFIDKLNSYYGKNFRLPTEAEWEYAASGGNKSHNYKYSGSSDIENVAWYYKNSDGKPHNVGIKKPNELGLYDMSGNVWEWTTNGKSDDYVERGGGCDNSESICEVTNDVQEAFDYTENRRHHSGLRLAM